MVLRNRVPHIGFDRGVPRLRAARSTWSCQGRMELARRANLHRLDRALRLGLFALFTVS